jgi:hypothetical protein
MAFLFVALATAASFRLGRKDSVGFLAAVAGGAVIGVAAMVALLLTFGLCLGVSICAQTTDHTVWALGYPLIFVPLYWLVSFIGWFSK